MKRLGWALIAQLLAMPAVASSVRPPAEVLRATQQFYIDVQPEPEPGEDPGDYPPRLPDMPDAKTVKAWLKAGVIRPVKVTPNAGADWLIDTGRMEIGNYYCGTGGCETQIWARTGAAYTKVFGQQVRDYRFHWIGKSHRTWMAADFHGSLCGQAGVAACPWGFEWRNDGLGHEGLFASWRFARREVLHPGAPPQSTDPMADPIVAGVPDLVLGLIAKDQASCKAQGADSLQTDGVVNRLPDLNADGIDDWSYNGIYSSCAFPDPAPDAQEITDAPSIEQDDSCTYLTCETTVWLSRRDETKVSWYRAPLDPKRPYALRRQAGLTSLVQLDNQPGITDDDPAACTTYSLDSCVISPISLSPNP